MVHRIAVDIEASIISQYQAGTTVRLIGEAHDVTRESVFAVLRRHGIPRRRRPGAKKKPWTEADLLRLAELRSQSWSIDDLKDEFMCGPNHIRRALEELGLPRRMRRRDATGRTVNGEGYVLVWLPIDDPLAGMAMRSSPSRYVLEHRLVMARHLGRPLAKDETVHHVNGVRDDNRIENLQLRQGHHGNHAAFICVDCGSQNVVPTKLL